MTKQPDSAVPQEHAVALSITPYEDRAWLRVQKVRAAFGESHINTIVDACKETGVDRGLYYEAMRLPYVQRKIVEENNALHDVTLAVVSKNHYRVLTSMVQVATDPKNRNAVGAARYLSDERDKAAEALGVEDQVADSTLDDLMHSFAAMPKAKKRVSATRKTKDGSVTLEVEGM